MWITISVKEETIVYYSPTSEVPDVLNGIEILALCCLWQNTDIPGLQEITHRTSSIAGGYWPNALNC
jgi:hypothetical protein